MYLKYEGRENANTFNSSGSRFKYCFNFYDVVSYCYY